MLIATNATRICTLTDRCKLTAIYCQMRSLAARAHARSHIAWECSSVLTVIYYVNKDWQGNVGTVNVVSRSAYVTSMYAMLACQGG